MICLIANATHIGSLKLPTVVIQEGGYSEDDTLGPCAAALTHGLIQAFYKNS